MLSDSERKTLRILYNVLTKTRQTPSVSELCVKTGRTREAVLQALGGLAKQRYVDWSPARPNRIVLLEGWERRE